MRLPDGNRGGCRIEIPVKPGRNAGEMAHGVWSVLDPGVPFAVWPGGSVFESAEQARRFLGYVKVNAGGDHAPEAEQIDRREHSLSGYKHRHANHERKGLAA